MSISPNVPPSERIQRSRTLTTRKGRSVKRITKAERVALDARVRDLVVARGPIETRDVAQELGLDHAAALRALRRLEGDGVVVSQEARRFDCQRMQGCYSGLFGGAGAMIRRFKRWTATD